MRRARLTAALAAAAVACAGLSGAMAQKLPNAGRCDVRIVPGPDSDESGCHLTEWSLPDGSGMAFHACPNRAGMEGVQKRLAAGEDKRTVLPDGNDRVLMGWSVEESSDPRWAAVTFDEKGNVNGGMLRDTKRTLFQVERSRSGQLLCVPNPDEIKLPGIDVHVEPGKDATEHHPHDHDGPDHFHDDHDGEWIEKAHHGRKLAKAYPSCARWSTLVVEVVVELDREFVNLNGGTAGLARTAASNIMNLVAANYESQIGVELRPRYHISRTPAGAGWQYTNTNANALLEEFRNRWETAAGLASERRGLVHLLTGKNIDGSVIGIAYVDVACDSIAGDAWNGEYEYGLSQATQASLGCNVGLVMHEIGHNAGSNHVSGAVMNPSLTCSNTFSASAISQIENHMDGHVPNDGTPDGCWCKGPLIIRDLPWWWKLPWKWFGPFVPKDVPEVPLPGPDPLPKPIPEPIPKPIPGPIPGPIPEPIPEPIPGPSDVPNENTPPPDGIPPVPEQPGQAPSGESSCSNAFKFRQCKRLIRQYNRLLVPELCHWEGPRRNGRCIAATNSPTASDLGSDACALLRKRRCRKTPGCDFDRRSRQCQPSAAKAASAGSYCASFRRRKCKKKRACAWNRVSRECLDK